MKRRRLKSGPKRAYKKRPPCGCGDVQHCPRCRASDVLRRCYADGRRPRVTSAGVRAWLPAEEALLLELAGHESHADVAERLAAAGYRPRTAAAIAVRITRLGQSSARKGHSLMGIKRLFRVGWGTAVVWVDRGWLRARRFAVRCGDAQRPQYTVTDADLEQFVTTYPWAYDWRALPSGRLRALAELATRRGGWLTLKEAAARFRVSIHTLDRWVVCGHLPKVQIGRRCLIRVRAADVADVIERRLGPERLRRAS